VNNGKKIHGTKAGAEIKIGQIEEKKKGESKREGNVIESLWG